jgi:hypothetical protein
MKKTETPSAETPDAPVLAIVTWVDASMSGAWNDDLPNPADDHRVFSAGWLMFESPTVVIMTQSLTDGEYGNSINIPRGMVLDIQRIELT